MSKPTIIMLKPDDLYGGGRRGARDDRPVWKQLRDLDRYEEVRDTRKKKDEKKPDTNKPSSPSDLKFSLWQVFLLLCLFGLPFGGGTRLALNTLAKGMGLQ